jgi:hypothetical protein
MEKNSDELMNFGGVSPNHSMPRCGSARKVCDKLSLGLNRSAGSLTTQKSLGTTFLEESFTKTYKNMFETSKTLENLPGAENRWRFILELRQKRWRFWLLQPRQGLNRALHRASERKGNC